MPCDQCRLVVVTMVLYNLYVMYRILDTFGAFSAKRFKETIKMERGIVREKFGRIFDI